MSDKVVINILPMGGGSNKGRLPNTSQAGIQRAAGVLPFVSKESVAESQVKREETKEKVSKLYAPNVSGSMIVPEFEDSKTFRGTVSDAVAKRGSTGSGGDIQEYIERTVPEVSETRKGASVDSIEPSTVDKPKPKKRRKRSIVDDDTLIEGKSWKQPKLPYLGSVRSAVDPFSPELVGSLLEGSDTSLGRSYSTGVRRKPRKRLMGFLGLGTLGDVADGGYSGGGGAGARAGLSGKTSGFSRTVFSRILERTGARGLARFASVSTLGAAIGGVQVAAGIGRIYSQVALARLNREAAVARTAYKNMGEQAVFSDILERGSDIKDQEVTTQFLETAQNFAPLVGIISGLVIQSKFPDMPILGKLGSTAASTVLGVAAVSAVSTKFASQGPQAAQYVASTIAQHVRSHMVRGGTKTLNAVGSNLPVDIVSNEHDFTYLAQATKLLNGQTAGMVGKSNTTAAAWAGVTSPFDVIRATANRMASPKIGVGAVGQSTRTAFKAEQETSLPKADNAIFRRLMRIVGLRSSDQILKEKLYYR
jgi:hypothetical protein